MTLVTFLFAVLYSSSWIETTADNEMPRLSIEWYKFNCIGGGNALLSTGLRLNCTSDSTDETGTYDQTYSNNFCVINKILWQYYIGVCPRNIVNVDILFEQLQHGRGSFHSFRVNKY